MSHMPFPSFFAKRPHLGDDDGVLATETTSNFNECRLKHRVSFPLEERDRGSSHPGYSNINNQTHRVPIE